MINLTIGYINPILYATCHGLHGVWCTIEPVRYILRAVDKGLRLWQQLYLLH